MGLRALFADEAAEAEENRRHRVVARAEEGLEEGSQEEEQSMPGHGERGIRSLVEAAEGDLEQRERKNASGAIAVAEEQVASRCSREELA